MNNCPKCGNPLEPGVTSCPICGNDLSNPNPPESNNVVQNNNINSSAPVAPVAPVANSNQSISTPEAPVAATPVAPTEPVAQAPVEPSPAPVAQVQTEQTSVAPSPAPVAPTPSTVAPTPTPVAATPIAPTLTPVMPTQASQTPIVTNQMLEQSNKPKGKMNLVLIAVVVIVIVAGVVIFMKMGNGTKTPNTTNNLAVDTTSVTSNGYKFNLPKTWLLAEDSNNVVINNEDNTVSIKLDHSESTITNINEDMIQKVISTHEEYTDTEVSKIKISAKDAYLVNTTINKMPVQIYFINGGSNLLIGVTIVYQSNDSKTKYEASVTQMIGTLSFADESIKALDTINMYSNIFNTYNSIINYHETPAEEPTPSEENNTPEENTENNNSEENSENN